MAIRGAAYEGGIGTVQTPDAAGLGSYDAGTMAREHPSNSSGGIKSAEWLGHGYRQNPRGGRGRKRGWEILGPFEHSRQSKTQDRDHRQRGGKRAKRKT